MFLKLFLTFLLIGLTYGLPQYSYNQGRSVPGTEFSGLANGQGSQGSGPAVYQGFGNGQDFNHRKGYQEMGY
ncbi:unnamed protein product [Pieris brassicae]|uniref:Uncharacterized protein n=1 Tax=Pieris brassicae TaxID=7116 RepID=A0A9P0XCX1_PIEBR|nr:unnamed protein product [Pieris brassicae]